MEYYKTLRNTLEPSGSQFAMSNWILKLLIYFSAHLVQYPNNKSKIGTCPSVKIHVQNRRFSLTTGVPPKLVHSWNLNDLRRHGPLEGGRFCFEGLLYFYKCQLFVYIFFIEGGSRCGKGEGIHILRLDDPQELQRAFEAAGSSRLESKRKSVYKCKCI